ncbi:glycosyltransferase family 4 protein [sulfur-oxidizing endosymbiont of Gigantopelta aegis]|uniref:glycosyltransferase family 4 protein n=1 Tax=sulfur-oxidizing endosymbiont of Gigantopelta aegis TaxID=2794934 RepID=UPI0018DDD9A5|nr:MraY family glycosyltransferase [sulfur-oxidizing endosymbiont of Gigantopelta aegis]
MDHPNERSSHQIAVPRGGGIAIVITFFIGMLVIYFVGDNTHIKQEYMQGFIISSLLIAGISFYDDIKSKSARFKLISQLIAVLLVLWFGIVLDELAFPIVGYVKLGWIGYVLSLFWIIGLTNAYNFMDGLDGLISGITVIASLFFMAISYYGGSHFVYISCYTLLAGSLGFLMLNRSPAKIFMGDVGSTFIGFTFATLAIIAARYDEAHISFFVVPLLLFNIIYDVIFTLIRRKLKGEKLTQAHRTHLYQLMNQIGYSHLEVSLSHYCMAFLQGIGALWMVQLQGSNRIYIFLPFLALQIIYSVLVIRKAKEKNIL